jgi:CubicO group peptidase (beta-lactamase class C family)
LKSLIKWMVLAAAVAWTLVAARDPSYWLARLGVTSRGPMGHSESSYGPRVVLRGGDQPSAPRESPASEKLDVTALQTAADYAEKQRSQALIVTRHGYIVFEKYWQGSNFDTVIDSQGLGRVIAALAAGVAIQERKIGWPDEPLSYFIPQWAHDPRGQITVRNLLQMSSGLGSSASTYPGSTIKQYLDLPSAAPPGERWLDQNADPDLLGYAIQRATGQPYPEFLSEAIWSPIGAGDASLWLDGTGADAHVDAGFFARQGDWLRVAELLLQKGNYRGGEVIVPRWVPELLEPAVSNPNFGSYLHLGTHTPTGMSPYATDDVFVIEGAGNRMWLVPSMQIAILRTGDELAGDWDESRIPNLIVRGARDFVPPAARPGADIRQIVPNH